MSDLECYRCGQEGHARADCPERFTLPRRARRLAPAPCTRAGEARTDWRDVPGYGAPVQSYVDPVPYADAVRAQMGWARGGGRTEERLRALAAQQAGESRMIRGPILG